MKLIDILKELNVPKPEDAYPLKGPVKSRDLNTKSFKYTFKNRNKDSMTVETNLVDSTMYVVFYETKNQGEEEEDSKYDTITNSGDMLKVLATVVRAVNRTADEQLGGMQNVQVIRMSPADERRRNVYKHYAKTLFPNFTVKDTGKWIDIYNNDYEPED